MSNTVTITQNLQQAMAGHAQGKVVCDGNAATVELGWIPSKVRIYLDAAAGAASDLIIDWLEAMGTACFTIETATTGTASSL